LISARGLAETLLARLHASGRVPSASVYLWDRSLDAFACVAVRGQGGQRPLAVVAPQPFTEPFTEGVRWFLAAEVQRRARVDAREAELARLMAAQGAGLTLPFVTSKGVVLGWVNLRDEDWSDGFTADELQGLTEIADLAAVALANISEFQALEEAHRLSALGAMAAGLAHEIRNPLAGIKGAAQFLQGEVGLSPDAQEMLDVVVVEADRLNVVVSQFLDYARPMNLQLDLTPLNALVSQALALVRAQGVPAGVRLEEQLDPDLPLVPLDPGRVRQVLLNLVQNGIQAMPEGGTLTLSTHRRQAPGRAPSVEVRVADTGRGVPLDVQDKLFVPFFTTKEHGTGLGLAISQRIVQRHGGEIELQSEPGAGAVFSVRLPIPDDGT
jgi:signal transduction histidine kinase